MVFNYQVNVLNQGNAFAGLASQASVFENHLVQVNNTLLSIDNRLAHTQQTGSNAFGGMVSGAKSFIATLGIAATTMSSLTSTAQAQSFENVIKFASGAEGAKNLQFLNKTVDDLALPIESAQAGYKTLLGGLMGTSLAGSKANDIFRSVAEGTTVMGLSGEETKGTFLALSQMASKGTVSAEELRGQLGERLPGAFGIAARAMGVTQQKLGKMLEDGEILATDFLPKFAREMHNTFGEAAKQAVNSAQSNFNRFGTELYRLKIIFGQEIMPTVLSFLQNYLVPSVKWVGQNIDKIGLLVTVLGTAWGVYKGISLGLAAYNAVQAISMALTTGFTGSVWALNGALWANPIVLVTVGLLALGAGVYYAWNKFEGFRAFMYGMGYAIKEFGSILYTWFISPMVAAGKILVGVFTGNTELIKSGMNDQLETLKSFSDGFGGAGRKIGEAFTKGWNDGKSAFNVDAVTAPNSNALTDVKFGAKGSGDKPLSTDDKTKSKIDGINGGGKQIRNISISVGKLVEQLTIQTTNIKEGTGQMRDMIQAELLQLLNSANQIQ
jgi:tape measure domain-containing protein